MESRAKRVRFEYDEPDEQEDEAGPRKLKFPKGKKGSSLEMLEEEPELGEEDAPDARVAAVERAARRSAMDEQLRTAEDTSNITDVVEAEEEFENDDNEQPLEPFNLKAERKDGYFDDKGHYVEYATKFEARDAWFDSAEVDTRFAHQLDEPSGEADAAEVSEEDKSQMKKRIAEILQPGETVLEGLRRLKGPNSKNNRREKMTGEAKAVFDQLTENAMKLMDLGESDVYDKAREVFLREAEAVAIKTKVLDMFADDEEEAAPEKPPEAPQVADSGYIFDDTSGYYYNAEIGYYYDPGSGLFCCATTGKWFKFDEETGTYAEVA